MTVSDLTKRLDMPHTTVTGVDVRPERVDPKVYGDHRSTVVARPTGGDSVERERVWWFAKAKGLLKFRNDVLAGGFRR